MTRTPQTDLETASARGEDVPPPQSPWGGVQHAQRLAEGIWHVATPGHGGFWLSPGRQRQIGAELAEGTTLKTPQWWEEDIDWAIPALVFADELVSGPGFSPDELADNLQRARAILAHWRPLALETIDARAFAPASAPASDD